MAAASRIVCALPAGMALGMLGVMANQFLVVAQLVGPERLLQVDALAPLLRVAALGTPILLLPGGRPAPMWLAVYCWGWVGTVAVFALGRQCIAVFL